MMGAGRFGNPVTKHEVATGANAELELLSASDRAAHSRMLNLPDPFSRQGVMLTVVASAWPSSVARPASARSAFQRRSGTCAMLSSKRRKRRQRMRCAVEPSRRQCDFDVRQSTVLSPTNRSCRSSFSA